MLESIIYRLVICCFYRSRFASRPVIGCGCFLFIWISYILTVSRVLHEQDQQISRLRESGSLLAQLVSEIEASFKELSSYTDLSQNSLPAQDISSLRSIDMLKHIRLFIHESFR